MWMITNSAGLSGAKPTRMLTMPRSMSFCGLFSRSHLTRYASRAVRALERALPEQAVHERADVEPDRRPQRLVVRLEHHPLRAAVQALLDEQRQPADRQVLPLVGRAGRRRAGCARPTRTGPMTGNDAQAVDAERVEPAVLQVGHRRRVQRGDPVRARPRCPAGRLPDPALDVGPRPSPRRRCRTAGRAGAAVLGRVRDAHVGEVDRRVLGARHR